MKFVCLAALLLACSAPAWAATVYDGSLNTLPSAQGWTYGALPDTTSFETASANAAGGFTTLNTTQASTRTGIKAGYSITPATSGAMPTLDRTTGYTIGLDVAVTAESHSSSNRAGFSVIALSQDHWGIELGFWTNTIFAQNTGFTAGESVSQNTTTLTHYDLSIAGSTYTLSSGGTELLAGSLRTYTAPGSLPVPPFDVYQVPSYLFVGDNTTSASATAQIQTVTVTLPEPATLALLAAGSAGLLLRRGKRSPASA